MILLRLVVTSSLDSFAYLVDSFGCYVGGMDRTIKVSWCYYNLEKPCMSLVIFVHCDVAFSIFLIAMFQMVRCSFHLTVIVFDYLSLDCGYNTPQCGGNCLSYLFTFCFSSCFCKSSHEIVLSRARVWSFMWCLAFLRRTHCTSSHETQN